MTRLMDTLTEFLDLRGLDYFRLDGVSKQVVTCVRARIGSHFFWSLRVFASPSRRMSVPT